jgi:hypothetical protein
VCSGFLAVIFFFAVTAWGQSVPREYYALRSTNPANSEIAGVLSSRQGLTRGPQELAAADGIGFDDSNVSEPAHAAITDVPALNKATSPASAPCGGTKQVIQIAAEPASTDTQPPATFTVRASALLELHEMRESAVDLCLQLPAKYRTQLPQCAEIFKHEIRLKALAKEQRP